MVAFGLLAFFNPRAFADPPQPAEKDSRPFFKPKNAVLTTSISPNQAKPGETVAFKVTAKLDPELTAIGRPPRNPKSTRTLIFPMWIQWNTTKTR
jgi:hypothetical protein